jgi:hypothetical protein
MPPTEARQVTRLNIANIAVILTSVFLAAIAIWPGQPTASTDAMRELRVPDYSWIAHGLSALLGIGSVFVGQRWKWRTYARLLLALAALLLVGAFVMEGTYGPRSILTLLLPGVVFAVAAVTFGPMPPPNE